MMYLPAERMLILEQYFASKSLAVLEAFSNAHLNKVPNKTTTHQLVMKFQDTGSVCL
jgi:hypothetical protein